jgi:hypothetical protein
MREVEGFGPEYGKMWQVKVDEGIELLETKPRPRDWQAANVVTLTTIYSPSMKPHVGHLAGLECRGCRANTTSSQATGDERTLSTPEGRRTVGILAFRASRQMALPTP